MEKKNKNSQFFIYGKHPTFSAIEAKKRDIYQIYITKNNLKELSDFLNKKSLNKLKDKIKIVDNNFIDLKTKNGVHQGFLLNCSNIEFQSENDLLTHINSQKTKPNLLILDQLTDPHNIGAIIRSAKAFNIDKIIFPENNVAKESSTMVKSSAGSIEFVDLYMVTNIAKLLEKLKKHDYWCFGLDGSSNSDIKEMQKYENVVLIIGSEGKGIRPLVKSNCDILVKISMNEKIESLNASVACSIALYELSKTGKNS